MATKVRLSDPFAGFTFKVVIGSPTGTNVYGGESVGYFTEISGIEHGHDLVEHKTVQPNGAAISHRIPGRSNWGEITLKRGVTRDIEFWKWRKLVDDGHTEEARREITIHVLDRSYAEAVVYQYRNAWPSKMSIGEISADSSSFLVEEVVLQHEGGRLIEVHAAPQLETPQETVPTTPPEVAPPEAPPPVA